MALTYYAFPSRTVGQVFVAAVELSGDWLNAGTATAGATTSLTDALHEQTPVANADAIKGTFLYTPSGTGSGQQAEINAYATLGVMGFTAITTAPDTTTTWVRIRRRPQIILDAMRMVLEENQLKHALAYPSEAFITGNLLGYAGTFEEWVAGTSTAPRGWTAGGAGVAVARESTIVRAGLYSAKITAGAGAPGTLTYTVPEHILRQIGGQSVTLWGAIAESAAADGRITLNATDKGGTSTVKTYQGTYASNRWEELKDISSAAFSLPDPVKALTVICRSIAGQTCYFDDLVLFGGYSPRAMEWFAGDNSGTIPYPVALKPIIWAETAYGNRKYELPLRYGVHWNIERAEPTAASPQIRLVDAPTPRHLRIDGFSVPGGGNWPTTLVATATNTVPLNPNYLAVATAYKSLQMGMPTGMDSKVHETRMASLKAMLMEMEKDDRGNPNRNEKMIVVGHV